MGGFGTSKDNQKEQGRTQTQEGQVPLWCDLDLGSRTRQTRWCAQLSILSAERTWARDLLSRGFSVPIWNVRTDAKAWLTVLKWVSNTGIAAGSEGMLRKCELLPQNGGTQGQEWKGRWWGRRWGGGQKSPLTGFPGGDKEPRTWRLKSVADWSPNTRAKSEPGPEWGPHAASCVALSRCQGQRGSLGRERAQMLRVQSLKHEVLDQQGLTTQICSVKDPNPLELWSSTCSLRILGKIRRVGPCRVISVLLVW